MKTIEVWAIYAWDGGERHNFAYHLDRSVGTKAEIERTLEARGSKHDTVVPTLLTIFDSFDEVTAHSYKELVKSAWAKLTPLERKALNMEEPKS